MKKVLSVLLSIALVIGTGSTVFAFSAQNIFVNSTGAKTQPQSQSNIIYVTGPFSSAHPYASNTEYNWGYENPNPSVKSVEVTFSVNTKTESGCDYITLYDRDDNFAGRYSGNELAGKSIMLLGNCFSLQMRTDAYVENYGFDITEIKEYTSTVFNGTCGDNLTWSIDLKTGLLDIAGTGKMFDYTNDNGAPWKSLFRYIKRITIAAGATSIGNYAFAGSNCFKSIDMPASIETIGNYAFFDCLSYVPDSIGDGVKTIGDYAFYGTSPWLEWGGTLDNLVLPDTLVSIGDYAFANCEVLGNVFIPNSVISIGAYAFAFTSNNFNITIGNGVETIGDGAFFDSLSTVYFTGNAPKMGSSVFGHTKDFIVYYYKGKTGFTNPWYGYETKNYYINFGCYVGWGPRSVTDILKIRVNPNNEWLNKSLKGAYIDVWFKSNLPDGYSSNDTNPENYKWSSDNRRIVVDECGHITNNSIFARAANITLTLVDKNGIEFSKSFKVVFYRYDWQLKYLTR